MMKTFMDKDFLLTTEAAKTLYHNYSATMPILDYHCHINPKEIAENHKYDNITQIWLGGDHYKWRLMRANGIEEAYITGDAPDREKFQKWAQTLEKAIGNPLYHWSHLELKRYFGYEGILNSKTAEEVWQLCNEALKELPAQEIIKKSGVTLICTTDDPVDSLEWHEKIAADSSFDVQILPAWRPDKAMNIEKNTYLDYLKDLSSASNIDIHNVANLKEALKVRLAHFVSQGCKISDHGLEFLMYYPASEEEIERIFSKRLRGDSITQEEEFMFKTAFMQFMAREYHSLDWAMQLHYGCKRDNNHAAYQSLGPDTGFDCINNYTPSSHMANFLNSLETTGELPKTVIYSLNPNDNVAIDTIIGCFQSSDVVGKVQHGSAWWFNDHKTGMLEQLTSLANNGLLGNFIGMLTDSRSFLSYTRHEYFRRILCDLIGTWIENGELPADYEAIGKLVKDISYNNAVAFFNFDLITK